MICMHHEGSWEIHPQPIGCWKLIQYWCLLKRIRVLLHSFSDLLMSVLYRAGKRTFSGCFLWFFSPFYMNLCSFMEHEHVLIVWSVTWSRCLCSIKAKRKHNWAVWDWLFCSLRVSNNKMYCPRLKFQFRSYSRYQDTGPLIPCFTELF